jgi:F-type H+-transporting ATPase subunit b
MPQIAQLSETYASQIFWVLIFFGLIFFVIGKGMVPKVMDTVAQRDRQISDDLAAAEAARKQADAEEAAWRTRENANRAEAQALIAKAKAEANAATEKTLAAANAEIERTIGEAEVRIDQARNSALGEIEDVAGEAAQDIVRRLAGVEIASDAAKSAVKEAMNHG